MIYQHIDELSIFFHYRYIDNLKTQISITLIIDNYQGIDNYQDISNYQDIDSYQVIDNCPDIMCYFAFE